MTTKWNLINPDLVPPSDKFSAEEEEEGKLFFWDVFSSPSPSLPSLLFLPFRFSSQVEKAKGRMGSDNAPAPVEWLMTADSPYTLQSQNICSKNTPRRALLWT